MTEEPRQPFIDLAEQILPQSITRDAVTAAWRRPETEAVPWLLEQARHPAPMAEAIQNLAGKLANQLRHQKRSGGRAGMVQDLLQEFYPFFPGRRRADVPVRSAAADPG